MVGTGHILLLRERLTRGSNNVGEVVFAGMRERGIEVCNHGLGAGVIRRSASIAS